MILRLAHEQFRPVPFFSEIPAFVLAEPDANDTLLVAAKRDDRSDVLGGGPTQTLRSPTGQAGSSERVCQFRPYSAGG